MVVLVAVTTIGQTVNCDDDRDAGDVTVCDVDDSDEGGGLREFCHSR